MRGLPRFVIGVVGLLLCGPTTPAGEAGGTARLADKTLVAWVCPANTTQRGSGVLAVQEGETFDAIVLGERVAGRWMAGSDYFRRTQDESAQRACPAETADSGTLVQLAVVYRGREVSVFRDGKLYSRYQVNEPARFDRGAAVLLGLRYLGALGLHGFFAGSIEEARLYDVALDGEQLARLAPDRPSAPPPIGQWTFADGTARDALGRFPPGLLCGGARIAAGRLHLNGTDAYVAIVDPPMQSMFYRAALTGGQWDTWLYWHEGTYYLFVLAGPGGKWHGIGLATSRNGVQWRESGMIVHKRPDVTWLGTGATWRSPLWPQDKRFFLNFSEWRGPRQTIFFAQSTDLLNWQRLGPEYEFVQDERWYQPQGRWDCIYTIPRPGGGLYGYWTATPRPETGGQFGFGQTRDGVKWEALPPPRVEGVGEGEVGAVEPIGAKYYMLFGTGGKMMTLVAESPQGPFRAAAKNCVLLSGNTYFARFFPTPDGLLVNHHTMATQGEVFFAPLKRAVVDAEGTLRLKWWPGNDQLRQHPVEIRVPQAAAGLRPVFCGNRWETEKGLILEGTVAVPGAEAAAPVGLFIEHESAAGLAILVRARGVVEIGSWQGDGADWKLENRVDRQVEYGPTARFRLLLKGAVFEFYLDDHLLQCWRLPRPATGRIGVIRPQAEAIKGLQAIHP
jgi:hypothetical protein